MASELNDNTAAALTEPLLSQDELQNESTNANDANRNTSANIVVPIATADGDDDNDGSSEDEILPFSIKNEIFEMILRGKTDFASQQSKLI